MKNLISFPIYSENLNQYRDVERRAQSFGSFACGHAEFGLQHCDALQQGGYGVELYA